MEIKKLEAAIEAILFTMGNSVELAQIADAIQQDKETTRKILQNMMDRYQQEDRGIQIIELEQSYQMCSKKEYYECLIRLAMHPKSLRLPMLCWRRCLSLRTNSLSQKLKSRRSAE